MILPARFRGRERWLKEVYRALVAESRALHPVEVARVTGLSVRDADTLLRSTPELFVRMPLRRGEPSRFRLASHVGAMTAEDVTEMIMDRARGERMLAFGVLMIVLSAVVVMALMLLPWLWTPLQGS
jgi:hypothetical protein